jgi:hypothetical protein
MKALIAQFGPAGYGRFWMLNEFISQAPEAMLDLSRKVIMLDVAGDLGFNLEELTEFLCFLSDPEIDLIHYENGIVWTDRTQENYKTVRTERERKRDKYIRSTEVPGKIEDSPGKIEETPDKKDTKQSTIKVVNQEADRQTEDVQVAKLEPVIDLVCLSALLLDVRKKIKEAPFPNHFDDKVFIRFGERLLKKSINVEYIDFCIAKAKAAKNPAGLLKKAILEYDSWIDEYRWEPQEKEPPKIYKLPERVSKPLTNEEKSKLPKTVLEIMDKIKAREMTEGVG